jgi:hypothetical protein
LGLLAKKEEINKHIRLSIFSMADINTKERFIDEEHLVVTCTLEVNNKRIRTFALVDYGATGYAFIDSNFDSHYQLKTRKLNIPCQLEVIDRRPIQSGDIIHEAYGQLEINTYLESLPLFVTKLGHYTII